MLRSASDMSMNGQTGVIFDIKRYALHDGPGIRTTVFLKGCPLRCEWCANAEGRSTEAQIWTTPTQCIRCGACIATCAESAITEDETGVTTDNKRCSRCGACVEACPSGARSSVGESVTVEELMERLEQDRLFFDESGGGVTFSGGEPLAQEAFLVQSLGACREREIHAAVDTSGAAPADVLEAVAARADLFLYDLKLMDDGRHREHVGISNQLILENLQWLVAAGNPVWIRVPLIPGINDDHENLDALAGFVRKLEPRPPIFLLPYHHLGSHKVERLGGSQAMSGIKPPAAETVSDIAHRLTALDLDVRIGG